MKMYHWGFDKARFPSADTLLRFLKRHNFVEVSHGYDYNEKKERVITYLNPDGVIFVTLMRGYVSVFDTGGNDGYLHYVGVSGFYQSPFKKIVEELRSSDFEYEDESPNERSFI